MLPTPIVAALAPGAVVVEVGVGGRWDSLDALRRDRPDLVLRAADLRPDALADPPAGVEAFVDDVFDPAVDRYAGATLLYAVRCPEELQPPLARLARRLDAALALHTLKDERSSLDHLLGPASLYTGQRGHPWRVWADRSSLGAVLHPG